MKREMKTDMTKGNIWKHIIMFAIPLIIGNVFQQFYSMVDTLIVGRTIGMSALAAVGATGSLAFLVNGFTIGLANGFAIMVSQRFGAGDMNGVRRSIAMGGMLSMLFAIIVTALSVTFSMKILETMNTPADIIRDSYLYIVTIFWGIPAVMVYNYMSSIVRALGDSKTPLYFLLIASVLNIILDFVCILVFKMGVMGAGVATVVSQAVSGILCLIYVAKKMPDIRPAKEDWKFESKLALNHIRLGVPMGVQLSIIASGSIVVQTMLNGFGTVAIAGFTAASRIEMMISQIMISFGLTLATFTGQNYGAKNVNRIREGVRKTTVIMMIWSVIGALLLLAFGKSLTMMFIDSNEQSVEEVVKYSYEYLIIMATFFPALSCIFIFRNVLQGIGKAMSVLVGSILELIGRLTGAIILAKFFAYTGLCFAGPCAWFVAAIFFMIIYVISIKKLKKLFI